MRKRIFFFLSLTLVFTLAVAVSPTRTWAFELGSCNEIASKLLTSCIGKNISYGWGADSQKKAFTYGCQYAGRTIFQTCKTESSCPAFLTYLNNPDSICGPIQKPAEKDGCYEMFKEWRESKLPFCPLVGIIQ